MLEASDRVNGVGREWREGSHVHNLNPAGKGALAISQGTGLH